MAMKLTSRFLNVSNVEDYLITWAQHSTDY